MKHWGSALFPLSILLALALLTFWLRYATELPDERHDGKNRHDPDYIVTQAKLSKINPTGALAYTIKADEIRHYPDNDTTDLTKPDVIFLREAKPPVTISAERGHMDKPGKRVDLAGDVRITRLASAKDPAMVATMPDLTVYPDDEKAFTKSPVLITQGKSWLKGVGMQVDNRAQTYILESQATAALESKHAKKKP